MPRRYPIWSTKTIVVVAIFVCGITAASVFFFGQKSLLVETELTLAGIAAALFAFLAVGLYRGVRIRQDHDQFNPGSVSFSDVLNSTPDLTSTADLSSGLDLADGDLGGCLGVIGGAIVAVILIGLFAVLLCLLVAVGYAVMIITVMAVGWVFARALRQVFVRSRTCRGKLGPSLGYALMYTAAYTGWLFGVTWLASRLMA